MPSYPFPATYYPQVPQVPQIPQVPQMHNGINWVQGESGAKSFLMAPNTTVMLMDSERDVFYIKTSDASGMPLPLRVFDYKERKGAPAIQDIDTSNFVTKDELEKLREEILGYQEVKYNDAL